MANFLEAQRRVDHMSYSTDSGRLGEFGCGASCSCKQCRSNLAEVYEEEEIPRTVPSKVAPKIGAWFEGSIPAYRFNQSNLGAFRKWVHRRQITPAIQIAPMSVFGEPPTPVFDVVCPACPPVAAGQCRAVLRQAIIEAIRLANNAAGKLDVANSVEPSERDQDAANTANLFRFLFGHDPSTPVPWAGNVASGNSVAHRLRAVARELGGGRRITFRCNLGPLCAGRVAVTNQAAEPNVMNLCATFWAPPASPGLPAEGFRAGTLIHEMLHMLYPDFFHHAGHPSGDPERRRDNAHCYKAFALRVGGYGRDPNAVARCRARSA
jgi:hypothetical protein